MKEINTASTALLIAERAVLDKYSDYDKRCTGEMYGTLSRSIKNIAKTNNIDIAKPDNCHQCGNDIDEPFMLSKVFCCHDHKIEYERDIEDNGNAMESIMLSDEQSVRQNAEMRIALHKLQSMALPHEASAVVNDALIRLAKDWGVA